MSAPKPRKPAKPMAPVKTEDGATPECRIPPPGTPVPNHWQDGTPLFYFSKQDKHTLRNAYEGTLVISQTGGGKSSGPGKTLGLSFLLQNLGGLVVTCKIGEADEWRTWAKLTGREKDLRVITPGDAGRWGLNILEYLYRSGGRAAGSSNNVVNALMEFLETRERSRGQPSDPFWITSARQLLTCSIDLLGMAKEPITFDNIDQLISSAASSSEEVKSPEWQNSSYLNERITRAIARKDLTGAQKIDLKTDIEYWLYKYVVMDEKTRSGIRATTASLTFPFQRSTLVTLFSNPELNNCFPEDCYRSGAIIVLDLPIKEYLEEGLAAQILFKSVWQKAMERRDVKTFSRPVFLFMDEYQNFATSSDPLFLATARSSRVVTVAMTQSIDALISRFPTMTGKAEAESLLANFNLKIFGSQDHWGTNEWAAKTIGEEWTTRHNVSTSLGTSGNVSAGTNEQRRFLVDPLVFSRIPKPDGSGRVRSICFRSGRPFSNGQCHVVVDFNQNAK